MKLVMTLVVRDEADIVKTNLEYHLAQGVDFIIATDHGSQDGTSDVLGEFERQGVASVIRDEEPGHRQSERVMRMATIARERHHADWLIHNDADEFWWPLVGDLRQVFGAVPARFGQIEAPRRNFRPLTDTSQPFHASMIHREVASLTPGGRPLESKVAHRPHPDVIVAPGNHSIQGAPLRLLPIVGLVEILHFPMRTYEQFERKVIQIGQAYRELPDREPETGCDQLRLYELHAAGRLREYYDSLALDPQGCERELLASTIALDTRLAHFMRDLHERGSHGTRADAPFAEALLADLMADMLELEDSRRELSDLRGERDRAHRLQADLAATSNSLQLLRSSRLLRSTTWARRAYYRARGKG